MPDIIKMIREKPIRIIFCVYLILTLFAQDGFCLRPASFARGGANILKPAPVAGNLTQDVEAQACLKKINELLWQWNFRIYELSHKRIYLRDQKRKTGNIFRSIDTVIKKMRKHIPSFEGAISEKAIRRLNRAIELLESKQKNTGMRAPNEGAANMLLTSVMLEASKMREPLLKQRLQAESSQPRIHYNSRYEKWYIREQRYRFSRRWNTAVLNYGDCPYDTMWEARRALDHQVDSELEERGWLLRCLRLLDTITRADSTDKDELKVQIDSMLVRLRKIKVEEKRLARIILNAAKALLDADRPVQAKGLLNITKDLFSRRAREAEIIAKSLQNNRSAILEHEADKKNQYLMDKAAKILHNLNSGHHRLTKKIIDEDLLNGYGRRYINEPDFAVFIESLKHISVEISGDTLTPDNIEALKRFFYLFRDRVISSRLVNHFMKQYRSEYIEVSLDENLSSQTREEAFKRVFEAYRQRRKAVAESPDLCRSLFYQAAFIAPKIWQAKARVANPEFLILSDAIMRAQAQKVEIRPGGLAMLLYGPDQDSFPGLVVPCDILPRSLREGARGEDFQINLFVNSAA